MLQQQTEWTVVLHVGGCVGNCTSRGCKPVLGIITLKHLWPSCSWMVRCTNSWHCLNQSQMSVGRPHNMSVLGWHFFGFMGFAFTWFCWCTFYKCAACLIIIIIINNNRGLNARWCLTPLLLSLPSTKQLKNSVFHYVIKILRIF